MALHLTAEFWGCSPSLLMDAEALSSLLRQVVIEVGMQPVGEPLTIVVNDGTAAWGSGASALQMLTESHASLHGLVERLHAYLDLFSCAPLADPKRLVRDIASALRATGYQWHVEDRTIRSSWWRRAWRWLMRKQRSRQ